MAFEIRSGNILANIFARDNINVVISNRAKTAYIELKSKKMTIPNWNVDSVVFDFLLVHETGHAKYTPMDIWEKYLNSKEKKHRRFIGSLLNICEDVRIDKIRQEEYRGTVKWYRDGMKILINNGFFGKELVGTRDVSDKSFPDRINIYSKSHYIDAFDFNWKSEEEKALLDKILKTKTFNQVMDVTDELFEYCLKHNEYSTNESKLLNLLKKGNGEGGNISELEIEFEEVETVANNKDYLFSKIDHQVDHNQREFFLNEYSMKDFVFDLKSASNLSVHESSIFYNVNKKLINFLAQEFERKKKARELIRTRQYNTGVLNTNVLQNYRFTNDIFVKNEISSQEKSHGFVFLVDLSSSMQDVINNVFKQLYIMAMFCKRIKVPFEVYGFSDNFGEGVPSAVQDFKPLGLSRGCLIKFIDHNDTDYSLIRKMENLINFKYHLHGTPLTTGLIAMRTVLDNFRFKNKIDKLNFILMSDGGCNDIYAINNAVITDIKTKLRICSNLDYMGYNSLTSPLFEIIKHRSKSKITVINLRGTDYNIDDDEKSKDTIVGEGFVKIANKYSADQIFHINSNVIFKDKNQYFIMRNFVEGIV